MNEQMKKMMVRQSVSVGTINPRSFPRRDSRYVPSATGAEYGPASVSASVSYKQSFNLIWQ